MTEPPWRYSNQESASADIDKYAPLNLLLVEGDPERSNLVRRLLTDSQIVGRLHTVGANVEAIAYLRRDAPYLLAPSPDFVLLGDYSPAGCASDFAKEIASNARLKDTQVIALEDTLAEGGASLDADCCDLKLVNPFALADTIAQKRVERSVIPTNLTEQ